MPTALTVNHAFHIKDVTTGDYLTLNAGAFFLSHQKTASALFRAVYDNEGVTGQAVKVDQVARLSLDQTPSAACGKSSNRHDCNGNNAFLGTCIQNASPDTEFYFTAPEVSAHQRTSDVFVDTGHTYLIEHSDGTFLDICDEGSDTHVTMVAVSTRRFMVVIDVECRVAADDCPAFHSCTGGVCVNDLPRTCNPSKDECPDGYMCAGDPGECIFKQPFACDQFEEKCTTGTCCDSFYCRDGECGTKCMDWGKECDVKNECCTGFDCIGGVCEGPGVGGDTCSEKKDCRTDLRCTIFKKCKPKSTIWIYLGVALAGVLLIILIVFVIFYYFKKRGHKAELDSASKHNKDVGHEQYPQYPPQYPYPPYPQHHK